MNKKFTIRNPQSAIRNGFTLVELLVVMAVLMLLAGILLPAMGLARQNIKAKITESNIILLATACDLYANDFDNTPPPSEDPDNDYFPASDDPTGAEILALLLTGYAPDAGTAGFPKENSGDTLSDDDGRSGFGFRTVRRGKIYGPYNGTEKIPTTTLTHTVFADAFDNPILYYRRDDLSADFDPGHNPGPEDNDYWNAMNDTDRLYLILSPGKDANWTNGNDEDDIMNQ